MTKRVVDAMKQPVEGQRTRIWDTELPGFGAVRSWTGTTTFVVRYRVRGRQRELTLGQHGPLTVDSARRLALAELGRVVGEGFDPLVERAKERAAQSWEEHCTAYMARVYAAKKDPRHDERFLALTCQRWGNRALGELTKDDVEAFVQQVLRRGAHLTPAAQELVAAWREISGHPGKDSRRGRTPHKAPVQDAASPGRYTTTANRALASVRACLADAWRAGAVPENVAMKVRLLPENPPRTRWLDDKELLRVLAEIDALENPWTRGALRFLIVTGCRRSEALGARWSDLDLERGTLTLRSPKAGRLQTMPLPAAVVEELRSLPREVGNPYVFCGDLPGKPLSDLAYAWRKVRRAAGCPDAHLHDLRRSYAQRARRAVGLLAASKLLRHSDTRVTAKVYAAMGDDETRDAAEQVAKVLSFKPSAVAR